MSSGKFEEVVNRLLRTPPKPHTDSKVGKGKPGASDKAGHKGKARRSGKADNRPEKAQDKAQGQLEPAGKRNLAGN